MGLLPAVLKARQQKLPGGVTDGEDPDRGERSAQRLCDAGFAGQGLGHIPHDGSGEPKAVPKTLAAVLL
jgi:hypothetical protein